MPRQVNFSREIKVAACLGAAALALNLLAYAGAAAWFPVGNILILMSAAAFGVRGALIAAAIGVMTLCLWTGDCAYSMRILALSLAVAYSSRRAPHIPIFFAAAFIWIALLGPLFMALSAAGFLPTYWPLTRVVFAGLSDVLTAMIAGAFLMSPYLWGILTHTPRSISITTVLMYTVTIISTLVLTGAILVLGSAESLRGFEVAVGPGGQLLILVVFGISIPALLAYLLAHFVSLYSQEPLSGGLMAKAKNTAFSGRSSEYWRRFQSSAGGQESTSSTAQPGAPQSSSPEPPSQFAAPFGICALRKDRTVLFANAEFKNLAQLKQNDIIGKKIDALSMHPVVQEALSHLTESFFRRGSRTIEVKLNSLPEELRFLQLSAQSPSNADSFLQPCASDSVIITLKDITDRRTVRTNLMQGQKLGALGTLVQGIGHLFNNVLTVITAQASFARHCSDALSIDNTLKIILRAAQEAGQLVHQLLDFAASHPSLLKPLALDATVQSRFELLRQAAGEAYTISFSQSIDRPLVRCDINLITQVLTNLVLNAKEAYGQAPGDIAISLDIEKFDDEVCEMHPSARAGEFARLRVRDHGCGMTPEVLARAFEPLYTTKASGGHIGLGLSTAYAIVRAHDGFLTIESRPDKGTTISFYLPIADTAEQTMPAQPQIISRESNQELAVMRGNNEGILVVEDDDNIREVICAMLSGLGYRVKSCRDGEEALQTFSGDAFDLILVDMAMPKMPGIELIQKIKDSKPQTQALLMTGYGTAPAGADRELKVLSKPFDIETLAQAIRTSLDSNQIVQ